MKNNRSYIFTLLFSRIQRYLIAPSPFIIDLTNQDQAPKPLSPSFMKPVEVSSNVSSVPSAPTVPAATDQAVSIAPTIGKFLVENSFTIGLTVASVVFIGFSVHQFWKYTHGEASYFDLITNYSGKGKVAAPIKPEDILASKPSVPGSSTNLITSSSDWLLIPVPLYLVLIILSILVIVLLRFIFSPHLSRPFIMQQPRVVTPMQQSSMLGFIITGAVFLITTTGASTVAYKGFVSLYKSAKVMINNQAQLKESMDTIQSTLNGFVKYFHSFASDKAKIDTTLVHNQVNMMNNQQQMAQVMQSQNELLAANAAQIAELKQSLNSSNNSTSLQLKAKAEDRDLDDSDDPDLSAVLSKDPTKLNPADLYDLSRSKSAQLNDIAENFSDQSMVVANVAVQQVAVKSETIFDAVTFDTNTIAALHNLNYSSLLFNSSNRYMLSAAKIGLEVALPGSSELIPSIDMGTTKSLSDIVESSNVHDRKIYLEQFVKTNALLHPNTAQFLLSDDSVKLFSDASKPITSGLITDTGEHPDPNYKYWLYGFKAARFGGAAALTAAGAKIITTGVLSAYVTPALAYPTIIAVGTVSNTCLNFVLDYIDPTVPTDHNQIVPASKPIQSFMPSTDVVDRKPFDYSAALEKMKESNRIEAAKCDPMTYLKTGKCN